MKRKSDYTYSEYFFRVIWHFMGMVTALIPRHLYFVRNSILRAFGAKIGENVKIYPSVKIMFPWNLEIEDNVLIGWDVKLYNLGKIKIGSNCVISQYAHLCAGTHDFKSRNFDLVKSSITVGKNVWIAAEAFIGPDVEVGPNSVIAARAVLIKNAEPDSIYGGNPAQKIKIVKRELNQLIVKKNRLP